MLIGLLGLGATTLLFAFAKAYWLLVLARALQGVAGAATWLPGLALLADHFGPEERGRAMGIAFAGANLGALLGPPLSGFLAQRLGPKAPFVLGAALVLLDAAGRAFLLQDPPGARREPIPFGQLLRDPLVRAFAGAMVLASGLWALVEATLPLHFARSLGLGPASIGLCFAAAALSHTCTSPLMGRLSDRVGRGKVLRLGFAFCVLAIPLPALLPGLWSVLAAMLLLGAVASFIMSPTSPGIADAVQRRGSSSYASGFAVLNISYSLGMMLGPFVGSALVQFLGLRFALPLVALGYGGYGIALRKLEL